MFPPEVNSRPVPITIIDDLIPEASENFRLRLFQVLESPTLDISGAITEVTITDEDGMLQVYIDIWDIKYLVPICCHILTVHVPCTKWHSIATTTNLSCA